MSQRVIPPKCAYRYSLSEAKKIYGALDLIQNCRPSLKAKRKHLKSSQRHTRNKTFVKNGLHTKTLQAPGNTANCALEQVPPKQLLNDHEKTRLSKLLTVYGEQHSPAYRRGFDTKNFTRRPHFPDLVNSNKIIGSNRRTSSLDSGNEQGNPGCKTRTLTLPDINHAKKI